MVWVTVGCLLVRWSLSAGSRREAPPLWVQLQLPSCGTPQEMWQSVVSVQSIHIQTKRMMSPCVTYGQSITDQNVIYGAWWMLWSLNGNHGRRGHSLFGHCHKVTHSWRVILANQSWWILIRTLIFLLLLRKIFFFLRTLSAQSPSHTRPPPFRAAALNLWFS